MTESAETPRNLKPVQRQQTVETADGSSNLPAGYRTVPENYSGAYSDQTLVELWLHGKSPATSEVYRAAYTAFMHFTSRKPLGSVTLGDLQKFADSLEDTFAPSDPTPSSWSR